MIQVSYLEQTGSDLPEGDAWLGPRETDQLARMRFVRRREDWRLGRWTVKRAVAACFGWPPTHPLLASIEILPAPSGAPRLFATGDPVDVSVSLSHRAGRAVCALATSLAALGCDIELIEPRCAAFVEDYFTAEEQSSIWNAPPSERPRLATLLWSAKESALKALGVGLRADTRSVAVRLHEPSLGGMSPGSTQWNPLCVSSAGSVFTGWYRHAGQWVWTILAAPPPAVPLALDARPTRMNRSYPSI